MVAQTQNLIVMNTELEIHEQMLYQARLDDEAGFKNTTAQCYRDTHPDFHTDYDDYYDGDEEEINEISG